MFDVVLLRLALLLKTWSSNLIVCYSTTNLYFFVTMHYADVIHVLYFQPIKQDSMEKEFEAQDHVHGEISKPDTSGNAFRKDSYKL